MGGADLVKNNNWGGPNYSAWKSIRVVKTSIYNYIHLFIYAYDTGGGCFPGVTDFLWTIFGELQILYRKFEDCLNFCTTYVYNSLS